MTHPALKVIRPIVKASSALSPRIVGKLAFRLFCTPVGRAKIDPRNPAIRKAQGMFARGTRRLVSHEDGFASVAEFRPEGHLRGSVLLLHGWASQGLFMAGFVEPLLAKGYRVLVLDLPAHGASSGRLLTFPRALQAITALLRSEAPLAGIVAHSFGGAVATVAASGGIAAYEPVRTKKLVLVSAPRGMQPYGDAFARMIGLGKRGHGAFDDEVLALTGRPMADFYARPDLAQAGIPTLVLHAPDDKEIPFSDAEELARAGNHVTLVAMPGLGHRRILFAPEVHDAAADFIAG
ncbi:MAG: alpha/beta hydrolase [Proteobacteria bacterium]|nr:alpha/beta hydrolase [Pseudomonadota bacterium]